MFVTLRVLGHPPFLTGSEVFLLLDCGVSRVSDWPKVTVCKGNVNIEFKSMSV